MHTLNELLLNFWCSLTSVTREKKKVTCWDMV